MLMRQEPVPRCGIRLFEYYVCYEVETANNRVKGRFNTFLMRSIHIAGYDLYTSQVTIYTHCRLRSIHIAGYDLYTSQVTICTHCRLRSIHIAGYDLYTSQVTICTHCRLRSVHIAGYDLYTSHAQTVHIARATCTDRLCRLSGSIGQVPVSWLFSWGWRSC